MKRTWKMVLRIGVVLMLLLCASWPAAAEDRAVFTLSADKMTVDMNGEVTVILHGSGLQQVYGLEMTSTYGADRLDYVSATVSAPGFSVAPKVADGRIVWAILQTGKEPRAWPGEIGRLTFKAKKAGPAEIRLLTAKLVKVDGGQITSTEMWEEGARVELVVTGVGNNGNNENNGNNGGSGSSGGNPDHPGQSGNPGEQGGPVENGNGGDLGDQGVSGKDGEGRGNVSSTRHNVLPVQGKTIELQPSYMEVEDGRIRVAAGSAVSEEIGAAADLDTLLRISIPDELLGTSVEFELGSDIVELLSDGPGQGSGRGLQVDSMLGSYRLPAEAVAWKDGDTALRIIIAEEEEAKQLLLEDAVRAWGGIIAGPTLRFEVSVVGQDGSIRELSHFGRTFAARTIPLATEVDPTRSTGVTLGEDGRLIPVPTRFIRHDDGKMTAVMHRNGNSTYAVVTAEQRVFSDTSEHWASEEIGRMASRRLINGVDGLYYEPDRTVTRAEFTAMLIRALGASKPAGSGLEAFTDVHPGDWHYDVIHQARSLKLAEGDGDRFQPDLPISRQEIAVLLSRTLALFPPEQPDVSQFPAEAADSIPVLRDLVDAEEWARGALETSVRHGLLRGDPNDAVRPGDPATRAEALVMTVRLLQHLKLI